MAHSQHLQPLLFIRSFIIFTRSHAHRKLTFITVGCGRKPLNQGINIGLLIINILPAGKSEPRTFNQ